MSAAALFILAPMDDVTDTVFRRIVFDCAQFDYSMTEFVNVDGLCSPGRPKLLPKLSVQQDKGLVIAQIWGKRPENFKAVARDIASGVIPGFSGIDINFGCPDKAVLKNECCSALQKPELRDRAVAIVQATYDGVRESGVNMPVSIKTRLGFDKVDYTWHELLLQQRPSMLTVHARTTKQMSKVPAQWDAINEVVAMRDRISPETKIILNGDILTRSHGQILIEKHRVDGVMIGRGVFHNPFCFSDQAAQIWAGTSKEDRVALFRRHLELFSETYGPNERAFAPLKKFAKVYIAEFPGAHELRERIMNAHSTEEALRAL